MVLNDLNGLRLEYSVGATVIMFSLIDLSNNKNILASNNVTNIVIEYSFNGNSYTYEHPLSFHINSCWMIIKNLDANTDIDFRVFINYYESNNEKYKIALTNIIHEHTLQLGNITYRIIPSENSTNDQNVEAKLEEQKIFEYINNLGTCVPDNKLNFNSYAQYAKEIPFMYNENIATADAQYYRTNTDGNYGRIRTSGGSYFKNNVMFHEMRHRYGITGIYSHLKRIDTGNISSEYSYIEDRYTVLHDALRFETGLNNAKVWVFGAHSNICEGDYTDNDDYNYLAANYIKALVYYTCHDTSEEDDTKIRSIAPLNIELISGSLDNIPIDTGGIDNGNNEHNNIEVLYKTNNDKTLNINNKNRKTINIGPYQYLYEYLKNGEDFDDIGNIDQFVILRNFEINNNILYDKDIYIIPKSIYDKIKNTISTNLLCYPLYKNGSIFFSDSYEYFSNYNITKLQDIHYDIYDDNTNDYANILCDKLRIYNPTIKNDLDYIIYIDNYINNIHFHYLCNLNSNYNKKYSEEIKVNKNRYIEYIDIDIPNIKNLFNKNNKFYIIEDFNKISSTNKDIIDYLKGTKNDINNKLYLSQIIQPYFIDKKKEIDNENNEKIIYIKTYLDQKYFNYNNNYINTSVNIILYPYLNVQNNLYLMHDILPMSSSFIEYVNYFRLSSKLGFDNGKISLLNEFIFPGKLKENRNLSALSENERIEYINKFTTQVTDYYNTFFLHENIINIENHEDFDDELDNENIRSTGYHIQFATDKDFNEIIWESVINTDNDPNNFIYDFSFSLNSLVDNWSQLNEILIVRTKFIDKRLNNVIYGNNVVINKEWFKYLINDTLTYQIKFNKQNNLITTKFMNVNKGFNFIDHINCNIIEESNNKIVLNNNENSNITKIIYKPIFYKVQDLQNIRLREGISQNIGINLGEYITKIDCFILNIDGQNIKENSRNDIYVIFNVNANNISNQSGYYNILNSDFEYISSGNYIKY